MSGKKYGDKGNRLLTRALYISIRKADFDPYDLIRFVPKAENEKLWVYEQAADADIHPEFQSWELTVENGKVISVPENESNLQPENFFILSEGEEISEKDPIYREKLLANAADDAERKNLRQAFARL